MKNMTQTLAIAMAAALTLGTAGIASAQSMPPAGPYMSPNAYQGNPAQNQQQAPRGNPYNNQAPGNYY